MLKTAAKYHIGQVLRHRKHPFRGVVFDVDAMFSNTEEWYAAIPEDVRPSRNQPFYHLLAENDQSYYVAYVSEQNLVPDETGEPVSHPDLPDQMCIRDRANRIGQRHHKHLTHHLARRLCRLQQGHQVLQNQNPRHFIGMQPGLQVGFRPRPLGPKSVGDKCACGRGAVGSQLRGKADHGHP